MNNSAKIGIGGEYIVKIIDKNGNERFPFGDKPLKNLILDTFFDRILGGYPYNVQAFVQSCRVGDSNTPPERTQTGLQGTLLQTTHKSSSLTRQVVNGSTIQLVRDFQFDTNATGSPVTYREATVGCFDHSTNVPSYPASGMGITVSRFVFPSDVIVNAGEALMIVYALNITVDYLGRNLPITLEGDGLDFTGFIRMNTNDMGLGFTWGGNAVNYVSTTLGTLISQNEPGRGVFFYYRTFTNNSNIFDVAYGNTWVNTFDIYSTVFATYFSTKLNEPGITTPNRSGFIDSAAAATSFGTYPTVTGNKDIIGPGLSSVKINNSEFSDDGASVIIQYYFPPHTVNRSVAGLRIWTDTSTAGGFSSEIYLRFTESNFSTPRTLTIPAGKPVTFKLKWQFIRN